MKEKYREVVDRFNKEKQFNGLVYGFLVGLAFGLGVWGVDALLLSRAHNSYSWLKLIIGLPVFLLIGVFVGWITTRLDNLLISLVIWLAFGLTGIFIASHMPYKPYTFFIGLIEPNYSSFDLYPFANSVKIRMGLLYVIAGGLTVVAGIFSSFIVEGATRASSNFSRWFTLMVSFMMFLPIGLLVDGLINEPLRKPVLAAHNLIQNGIQAEISPVSEQKARELGLRALKPFAELIQEPYQLNLAYYDPESLSETSVHVKFSTENGLVWGNCFVLDGYPTFCQLSSDLYLGRLSCLMQGGQERKCRMLVNPEAPSTLVDLIAKAGDAPPMSIEDQFGSLVLINLLPMDKDPVQCSLLVTGDIILNECNPILDIEKLSDSPIFFPASNQSGATSLVGEGKPQPLRDQAQLSEWQGLISLGYDLDVEIELEALMYKGNANVDYVNKEGIPLNSLFFRLLPNGGGGFGNGSLSVSMLKIGDEEVPLLLSKQNTVLEVKLPTPLGAGQDISIDISFEGRLPNEVVRIDEQSGYGIFSFYEQVLSLAAWYPMLAVYDEDGWNLDSPSSMGDSIFSDMATYSVSITLPENMQVAATGVELARDLQAGNQTLYYESGPARDFFIAASPNFGKVSQEVDGTWVNVFYLPGYEESARQALSISAVSLGIFNMKFGAYPYTELDVVQAPMQYALGVEFPGMFLVSSQLFNTPEKPEFAVTVAHEVSHQWWYNIVGNDVFDDPWLDEGLATYSSSLYYEFGPSRRVPEALLSMWQSEVDRLIENGQDQMVTLPLGFFEGLGDPSIYGDVVYKKAALFYVELRKEIGDDAFFTALKNYYRNQQFRIASNDDLLMEFEAAADGSLDKLFQTWLFSKQP